MKKLSLLLTLCLATLGTPALAQGKRVESGDQYGLVPTGGVHLGSPERLRAAAGVFVIRKNDNPYGSPGLGLTLEPGLDGGKLSLAGGYVSYLGSTLLRLTFMRTWDRPWNAPPNQNYLGLEVQAPIPFVLASAVRLGAFRSQEGDDSWLLSWSLGVGI